MSGRIFQNVVLQFKDTTDRTVGVIDAEGTVIACSELTGIGKKWAKYVEAIDSAEGGCIALEGKTFKALPGWGGHFDYAVFATGDDSVGRTVCAMACVALNSAKTYYEEKHDKGSFIKNIISDNILISDIYMRAKELHVAAEVPRGVFVIRPVEGRSEGISLEVVQNLFPDRQNDFVISVGETDVALIHQMPESTTNKDLEKVATTIEEALREDGESRVFVGIGTLALHLRDLAKSYKEAQIAIEVGKVFDTERYVINYENLGIGRLIYQLPTTLCEMFLQEVFKKNPIDALDQETLFTIYKFFENNLNVSETARKLFVHRNTLVYRLEKIKKLTGLDLREFDDAITFKVALMVKKYLTSRGIDASRLHRKPKKRQAVPPALPVFCRGRKSPVTAWRAFAKGYRRPPPADRRRGGGAAAPYPRRRTAMPPALPLSVRRGRRCEAPAFPAGHPSRGTAAPYRRWAGSTAG